MDEEIERLLVSVRADTAGFARDVAAMRGELDGPLSDSAARAGRALEGALLRAVRTGKLGFEDLKRSAMAAMAGIAGGAIRDGMGAITGGAGLLGTAGRLAAALLGAPGRAVGGPVAPGRPYLVGERGPELFVPTASGHVETGGGSAAPREVRVRIQVEAPAGAAPEALKASGRQVARAVREALARAGD